MAHSGDITGESNESTKLLNMLFVKSWTFQSRSLVSMVMPTLLSELFHLFHATAPAASQYFCTLSRCLVHNTHPQTRSCSVIIPPYLIHSLEFTDHHVYTSPSCFMLCRIRKGGGCVAYALAMRLPLAFFLGVSLMVNPGKSMLVIGLWWFCVLLCSPQLHLRMLSMLLCLLHLRILDSSRNLTSPYSPVNSVLEVQNNAERDPSSFTTFPIENQKVLTRWQTLLELLGLVGILEDECV